MRLITKNCDIGGIIIDDVMLIRISLVILFLISIVRCSIEVSKQQYLIGDWQGMNKVFGYTELSINDTIIQYYKENEPLGISSIYRYKFENDLVKLSSSTTLKIESLSKDSIVINWDSQIITLSRIPSELKYTMLDRSCYDSLKLSKNECFRIEAIAQSFRHLIFLQQENLLMQSELEEIFRGQRYIHDTINVEDPYFKVWPLFDSVYSNAINLKLH